MPTLIIPILLIVGGIGIFILSIGALIRYKIHRNEQLQVLNVFQSLDTGKFKEAIYQCKERLKNPYLNTLYVAFQEYQSEQKPELNFIQVKKASVKNLGFINYFDRSWIIILLVFIFLMSLFAIFQMIAIESVELSNNLLYRDFDKTWNNFRSSIYSIEPLIAIIAVLFPLLIWTIIVISLLLLEPTKQRYLRLQLYAIKLIEDLYKKKEKWNDFSKIIENMYAVQWNWLAFIFKWFWYLAKGIITRGLILLLLDIIIFIISLTFNNFIIYIILMFLISIYCGFMGNWHLHKKRKNIGMSLLEVRKKAKNKNVALNISGLNDKVIREIK